MIRRVSFTLSSLVALALVPFALQAQDASGTVSGRVTNAAGQPLADTRIQVIGTTRGTQSAPDGTYRISGVPVGALQVRATRLGYLAQMRSITLAAAGSAEANFTLTETATSLDQVVVTATGETQRKRESGVSVGTIDTSMVNLAAAPLLSNVLSSRTPGVTVQQSSGTTGTGSRVRIRGSNSINLSNEPLIIVDGIRVNNSASSFSMGVGGQTISRLEDFNPEEIESIDIIKGPAAAALYGTAAANGVIQISTKKGRAGRTRWNAYEEYGNIEDTYTYPDNWSRVGTIVPTPATGLPTTLGCTLEREILGSCIPKSDSLVKWNPIEQVSPFNNGWRQVHGLNATGGNEATTYFVGGEYEREQGIYAVNQLKRLNGRSNIRMQLRQDLDASLTLGLNRYRLRLPYNDNSAFGAIAAGFLGKAIDCSPSTFKTMLYCGTDSLSRGYFNANIPSTQFFNADNEQQNDRLTAGLQTNWTPRSWLKGTGQIGMDVLNRADLQLLPPNSIFFSTATLEGSRTVTRFRTPTYNATGSMTASYDVPWYHDLRGSTTAGAQYIREDTRSSRATGDVLLPGTGSLGGASARFVVAETNQEVITVGGYTTQQLSYADRMFLTLGIRSDRNSNFGTKFTWVAYPSANFSWVLSDESFFPKTSILDQFRFRAGWGKSGQRPVFRDAADFFNPVAVRAAGAAESPAITIGGTGNASLRPEVSAETEAGFESSWFGNKLAVEFTGYTKKTNDAIVSERLAPSLGVFTTRLKNLGTVENKGLEALVTVQMLSMANVDWSTTVTGTATKNKLMSGLPTPIFFGFNSTQTFREGFPLGAYWERKILSYEDLNGDGIISRVNCPAYEGAGNPQLFGGPKCELVLSDSMEYLGSPLPTREATLNTGVTLFKNFRVSALFDYRGGYKIFNSTSEFRQTLGTPNVREMYDKTVPFDKQARVAARLMGDEVGFIEDASFTKLREVSLTATAPIEWARRVKVQGLSLTFAGRNLGTWTNYSGLDPEVNANAGTNFTTSDFLTQPPVRYFVTRLNVNF